MPEAKALIDQGISAESSGKLDEALEFYQRAIGLQPRLAAAHMNLGIVLHANGELASAIISHRRAVELDPDSAPAHYNLAQSYLEAGDSAPAEAEFRKALDIRQHFPEAWVGLANALEALQMDQDALSALHVAISQRDHYVGAQLNASELLRKTGESKAAEKMLAAIDLAALFAHPERHAELESVARQMVLVWPNYALGWRALGTVLALRKDYEAAVPALAKAVTCLPLDPELHNALGVSLQGLNRLASAEASFRSAIEIAPDFYDAHCNLGNMLSGEDRTLEAEGLYRRALKIDPFRAQAYNGLGVVLQKRGCSVESEENCRRAAQLDPRLHFAHFNHGIALEALGRLPEAETAFRRAIELSPDSFQAHTNLGNILQALKRLSDSEASYRTALELNPDSAATHSNLGSALRELGRIDDAEASFRRALELDPDFDAARSNLLFTLNCTDRLSRTELFEEHLGWARRHEAPSSKQRRIHKNVRAIGRKLRIGYVSPDFRRHSIAYFIEPVLAAHDREAYEVFCYSNVAGPDAMTQRLLGLADCARNIAPMSDAVAADLVSHDGIDILVDLAGHTSRGRLGLFALKAAPIQVTYLGYPNTSGIEAMDWRLTDVHADPPVDGGAFYSEKLMRLEQSFLCFRPPHEAPNVQHPPHLDNSYTTFGSFNALCKITPEVVALWARLLVSVANSRILLKAGGLSDDRAKTSLRNAFLEHGIEAGRVLLRPMDADLSMHLARYHEVDIALDPFPYNGTTTTLEALWMGVPVVSLVGNRHAGRVGASILANIGLGKLTAASVEEYVSIATSLASDSANLERQRARMRERVSESPLCDEAGFTRALENVYRTMWRDWCAGQ